MSLFSKLTPEQVVEKPFPHVVVENVLDQKLCQKLIGEFPSFDKFTKGKPYKENQKLYLQSYEILKDLDTSTCWKEFILENSKTTMAEDLIRIFKPYILKEYPDFEKKFGLLNNLQYILRDKASLSISSDTIFSNFQAVIHTPSLTENSVERLPHVKILNTLFIGYLYLRSDDDEAKGADHVFYSIKTGKELILGKRQTTQPELLTVEKIIPYKKNTLVVFMNTSRSVQGVTTRSPSPAVYKACNFSVFTKHQLFNCKFQPGVLPTTVAELLPWYKKYPYKIRKMITGLKNS